tara:strand:- start:42 stop:476 length:435 start_codon:yes stop_codon:yes gene_type:complete
MLGERLVAIPVPVVEISVNVVNQMMEHSLIESPLECCGLLMGDSQKITQLWKMKNIAKSPIRFEIEPKDLLTFSRYLEKCKLKHLGIYHSHPSSEAYPSQTDIAEAYYPECSYFIISLLRPTDPNIRAFTIVQQIVQEKFIQRF